MRKGLLIVSILLFLAGGVALTFAFNSFFVAAANQQSADKFMKQSEGETDMARMQQDSDAIKEFAIEASDARQMGWLGVGGGVVLLLGSVVLFLKSRRPPTAAPG